MTRWDVAIVGGGPAGLSAALFLSRARLRCAVFESPNPPRNAASPGMHGLVGLDGVTPDEYRLRAWADLRTYGVATLVPETVTDVLRSGDGFELYAGNGPAGRAAKVLLAVGVEDMLPDVPGFAACWGRSIIGCPHCSGWEHRDRAWGVVTDHARYAAAVGSILAPWTTDVRVIAPDEIEAVRHDNGALVAIELTAGRVVECETLFWHLPQRPVALVDRLADGLGLDVDPVGFVVIDGMHQTSVPGMFAAGDLASKSQNLVGAVAAGAKSAAWLLQST